MHNKHIHLLSIIYSQTFPPNVALSHHFHYFYGSYDIETSFICANIYIIINLTCLEVFSSISIFLLLLIIILYIIFTLFYFLRLSLENKVY